MDFSRRWTTFAAEGEYDVHGMVRICEAHNQTIKEKERREGIITEAVTNIKEWVDCFDIEMAHGRADDILCDTLIKLGAVELVAEYKKVSKWYA